MLSFFFTKHTQQVADVPDSDKTFFSLMQIQTETVIHRNPDGKPKLFTPIPPRRRPWGLQAFIIPSSACLEKKNSNSLAWMWVRSLGNHQHPFTKGQHHPWCLIVCLFLDCTSALIKLSVLLRFLAIFGREKENRKKKQRTNTVWSMFLFGRCEIVFLLVSVAQTLLQPLLLYPIFQSGLWKLLIYHQRVGDLFCWPGHLIHGHYIHFKLEEFQINANPYILWHPLSFSRMH